MENEVNCDAVSLTNQQLHIGLTFSIKSDIILEGFSDRLSANQLPYRERAEG